MIVQGKDSKISEYKFTATAVTILYVAFQIVALFNNRADYVDYNEAVSGITMFERYGVGICVLIYDLLTIFKLINYKNKDKMAYFIHPAFEKLIEVFCLACIIIGIGVSCFY